VPERAFGTKPIVLLDGNRLPGDVEPNVLSVTVDSELGAPGACEVVFADPERKVLDSLGVDFLQPLEIQASAVEETEPQPLFVGEVYGFDFMFDETGTFAIVRAYDAAYRLKQRRAVASFNDVTDGDVVRQLAGDAGVDTGTVDNGEVIHRYLAQLNQSHWDFLQERALANDRVLHVQNGKLDFTRSPEAADAPAPGDHASTNPLQLTAGHNLVYLRARSTAAQQVGEVEVRGWDPGAKQAVVATATSAARGASASASPDAIGSDHGAATRLAAAPGLTTQADCDVLAASVAERVGTSFTHVEGLALGDPRLRAGVAVSLGSAGRFDGRYTLSSARHVFDDRGYFTSIAVTGEHDRSMLGLTSAPGGNGSSNNGHHSFDGVYPALVTNVQDPDKLGRIKVNLPWLAEDYESDWARVMQIGAGADRGILWFPEVGDEVAVAFLAGEPSRPMVLGGLYNGTDTPPFEGFADSGDGQIDTRALRTRVGHTLVFEDTSGEESIRLETGDGAVSITLDQAGKKLAIATTGDVTVEADGEVSVKARDITLDASGTASIKGQQGLELSSSTGEVSVSGMAIKLN
jgi:phage protein D/phage baseplate assembly protein gpV